MAPLIWYLAGVASGVWLSYLLMRVWLARRLQVNEN